MSIHCQRFYYETIDSTNEEAKRLIAKEQIQLTPFDAPAYVIADAQTAGKGTQGRRWISPSGAGLYLSVIHLSSSGLTTASEEAKSAQAPHGSEATPPPNLTLTHHYTRAAGVACALTLGELFGLSIQLKPINDLYAICPRTGHPKKLGGILIESLVQDNLLKALITGVGINIRAVKREFHGTNAHPDILPISLEDLLPIPFIQQLEQEHVRTELVTTLIQHLCQQYRLVISGELTVLEQSYQKYQLV